MTKCAVCSEEIGRGEGTYYKGRHIHKKCKDLMKAFPWRFADKEYDKK